jgi:23S rRNA pseudouridine2457 synthase
LLLRFFKPFGVLSQFRDTERTTLADYIDLPKVYPAGRLDMNSEGLMLLTDSGAIQARISHPRYKLEKVYLAQVEGHPDASLAGALTGGVELRDGMAFAAWARLAPTPTLPARHPPVTAHRDANSSWVELALTGGRNRQVRRMLAALGYPVLRLVRTQIGPWSITGLNPGDSEVLPPGAEKILWRGSQT